MSLNHDGKVGTELVSLLNRGAAAPKSSLVPAFAYSLIVAIGALGMGFTLGFTSPVGNAITHDIHLTTIQSSFFSAIVNIGAMAGSFLAGYLADKFGRRLSISLSCLPSIGGYIALWQAQSYSVLLVGRILTGFGLGMASMLVPVYISEISPAHGRGALGSIMPLAVTSGVMLVYALGTFLSWRILALVGSFTPAALMLASFFIPETPRYLLVQRKELKAQKALQRLRGTNFMTEDEMAEIQNSLQEESSSSATLRDLFVGPTGRALFVGVFLMIFQQLSGIDAIVYFTSQILNDAGFAQSNAMAMAICGVQVVASVVACFLMDRMGRRVLLMVSLLGNCAALACLGYFFFLYENNYKAANVVALVSLMMFMGMFSLGLGGIPWLLMSEIFPSHVSGIASGVLTLLQWSFTFAVTLSFNPMISAFGQCTTFWIFSAFCLCGTIFVMKKCPETKGKTLEEVQQFFIHGRGGGIGDDLDLVKATGLGFLLLVGVTVALTSL